MENQIFFMFYNLAHKSIFFDRLIIFLAEILPYLFILAVGLYLIFHKEKIILKNIFKMLKQEWQETVLVFFSGILAWFFTFLIKNLLSFPRPFVLFDNIIPLFPKNGFSFPSGHATFFMALAFAIFLIHKKHGFYFILIAFLIGLARIVAGVHFPIDILAGFVLGILIAFFVRFLYKKLS
jgi:undecaprenyl-diphosphatase